MTDFALVVVLFVSMLALSLSYALVMIVLHKELRIVRYRTVLLITTALGAISLGFMLPAFTEEGINRFMFFSALLLALAFLVSIFLVVYNRIKISVADVCTKEQHTFIRLCAITAFALFLLHNLALLAGVTGF